MVFNVVDWVVLGLVVLGGVFAALTGFFNEMARRLGLVAGLFAGLAFTDQLAGLIARGSGLGRFLAVFVSYIAIFMAAYAILAAVGSALGKLFDKLSLGFVDRMFGFFLGVVESALGLAIIWMLISNQSFLRPGRPFTDSFIVQNILAKLVTVITGFAGALAL